MNHEEDNFENVPDMAGVEYQMAMESVAKIYNNLRSTGLPKDDAAAIVAAILRNAE